MVRYYYAAFIPDEESGFSIFCPDFPEVASQGETVEECIGMAAEAIALSVEEYVKARKPLPEPPQSWICPPALPADTKRPRTMPMRGRLLRHALEEELYLFS